MSFGRVLSPRSPVCYLLLISNESCWKNGSASWGTQIFLKNKSFWNTAASVFMNEWLMYKNRFPLFSSLGHEWDSRLCRDYKDSSEQDKRWKPYRQESPGVSFLFPLILCFIVHSERNFLLNEWENWFSMLQSNVSMEASIQPVSQLNNWLFSLALGM